MSLSVKYQKRVLLIVMMLPLIWLVMMASLNRLGANPVEFLVRESGLFSLWMLLISLSLTPLRNLGVKTSAFRRRVGLIAFFYMVVHLAIYLVLDREFYLEDIILDFSERTYIIVGLIAFCLTLLLALTSTQAMQKRLKKYWKLLHRSVYLIGLLAIAHFLWAVKADLFEPLLYGSLLLLLLLMRTTLFKQIIQRVFAR